jgi:hypothetical protein
MGRYIKTTDPRSQPAPHHRTFTRGKNILCIFVLHTLRNSVYSEQIIIFDEDKSQI